MRLYHNPRCSKSRQAVKLLTEHGVQFEEYRYLDLGIALDDIDLLSKLDGVIRVNDISDKSKIPVNVEEIRQLLQTEAKVLQRPILIRNNVAIIGRPPEEILTLLREA
ncbi:MAG: arsenate reductase (glutaredoxin) [Candidatus Poseidoniales archaeon]|nr:MAG: arsenate reductase (glutaredoxin) [Candidatus Poseidoniales archaeon]